MKAEADPWKIITLLIIVIVCTILIIFFFTDKFSSGSSKFSFDCWELEIPGRCFCEDETECATAEGREECRDRLRRECNE